jgi:hypothetical protein
MATKNKTAAENELTDNRNEAATGRGDTGD